MSMNRILSFFIYTCLFVFFKEYNFYGVLLILCICWYLKYRDTTLIILLIFLLWFNVYSSGADTFSLSGQITKLTKNSIVIEENGNATLISNCPIRNFDAVIEVEGNAKKIESAPSNFGSQFETWAKENKISYSVYATNCKLIKQLPTLRRFIQKKVDVFNESNKDFLYKIIFQVTIDENSDWYLFNVMGLSVVGIITLIRSAGKYVFNEKQLIIIEFILIIVFSIIYQFSFVCFRLLISFLLRFTKLDTKKRTGILGMSCILIFPQKMSSLQFLIPLGIRTLQAASWKTKKVIPYFWMMILQSLYFSKIQLGMLFLYRIFLPFFGLICVLSWLSVFIGIPLFIQMAELFLQAIALGNQFTIYGNPLGAGIILYFLLIYIIPNYRLITAICLYIIFCWQGLFHPFAHITWIQIDQGDAILIQEAFQKSTTLIDTGKEKNFELLERALHARSITEIDSLVLTHLDEDHCGGVKKLQQNFMIHEIITNPRDIVHETMVLKSLNIKKYNNDNDNSLVYVLFMKDLQILLTGDISSDVELDLIQAYDLSPIDILKLGHHGSKTSTSVQFLQNIRPQLVVNSSGLNNKFKHPSLETIQRLDDFGIRLLDTQKEGDISIFFLRNSNLFITSTRKIGIIDRE